VVSDPKALINTSKMSSFQITAVGLCVFIAALDGFDTLCVAYTAPSISRDWSLGPASLGVVLSAALGGMAIGSFLITPMADKIGRRPIILISLAILAIGMLLCAFSRNVVELAAARAPTGLGIGSMLANLSVLVAEYASDKRRDFAVSLMTIGYPIGATLGGAISIYLIANFGWRSVFGFGALVAIVLTPLALIWLPESIQFLIACRPPDALQKINRILKRMGHTPIDDLPVAGLHEGTGTAVLRILRPPHLIPALATCLAYFCTMITVYFFLNWTPKLLTELGFSISAGISSSLLMNLAGIAGCLIYGSCAHVIGARPLAAVFIVGLFAAATWFGMISGGATLLTAATAFLGFCLFTVVTALYVLTPSTFPTQLRSTGTGVAMSVGRIGAFTGPLLAGALIAQGWPRADYCLVMALPALLTVLCIKWMGSRPDMKDQVMAVGSRPIEGANKQFIASPLVR
jgi:benzoate transport